MKRYQLTRIFSLILLSVLLGGAALQNRHAQVIKSNKAAVGGPSYLLTENFEGTGYENSWTEVNTPDPDSTSPLLEGAQSWKGDTVNDRSYINITANPEVWAYFLIQLETTAVSTYVFRLDSGGTPTGGAFVCELNWTAGGAGKFRLHHGSVTALGATVHSAATTYHVWLRCVTGTGSNGVAEVYVAATGTKPAVLASITTGTGTGNINAVVLQCTNAGSDVSIDKLRVDDVSIGDNPT